MKITAEIRKYKWDGYYRHYLGTQREEFEVEQVTDWRCGLCLCKQEREGSWEYELGRNIKHYRMFLVNSNHEAIYYHDSDYYWEKIDVDNLPMERVFGGFYVVYEGKSQVLRTYPGQDHDTDYNYYQQISTVITEDGRILKDDEKCKFLKKNKVHNCIELFDNRVLFENKLYSLDTYSFIKSLPKDIELVGKYKDGLIHAEIKYDYCNLIVLVKNKRIVRYFNENDFIDISHILGVDIYEKNSYDRKSQIVPPNTQPIICKTNYITSIKDYYYELNPRYNSSLDNFSNRHTINIVRQYKDYTGYYKEKGIWYKIDIEDLKQTFLDMLDKHSTVRNFITRISFFSSTHYNGKSAKLYRFECRPYGYIDTNGNLIYNFNPNKINWY